MKSIFKKFNKFRAYNKIYFFLDGPAFWVFLGPAFEDLADGLGLEVFAAVLAFDFFAFASEVSTEVADTFNGKEFLEFFFGFAVFTGFTGFLTIAGTDFFFVSFFTSAFAFLTILILNEPPRPIP